MQYVLKTPLSKQDLAPLKAGDTVLLSGVVYTAAAGPPTSGRMDAYTPRLLDLGLACMIGKGKRTDAVKQSVVKNGAVYLAAIGGAGALMAGSVQSCEIIAWPDLGCEAVRKLVVKDFPLTVLLDTHGGDLYRSGPAAYLASREHNA